MSPGFEKDSIKTCIKRGSFSRAPRQGKVPCMSWLLEVVRLKKVSICSTLRPTSDSSRFSMIENCEWIGLSRTKSWIQKRCDCNGSNELGIKNKNKLKIHKKQ